MNAEGKTYDSRVKEEVIYSIREGNELEYAKTKAVQTGKNLISKYKTDNWIDIINTNDELFTHGENYFIFEPTNSINSDKGLLVWKQSCFNPEAAKAEKEKKINGLNDEMGEMNQSKEFLENEIERKRAEISELKAEINIKQTKIEMLQKEHETDRIKWQSEKLELQTKISQLEVNLSNEQWKAQTEKKYEKNSGGGLSDIPFTDIVQGVSALRDIMTIFKGGSPSPSTSPIGNNNSNYEMKEDDFAQTETV